LTLVFFFAVLHGFMAGELAANVVVVGRFPRDVHPHDRHDIRNPSAIHMEASGRAAALNAESRLHAV
jgi:hypothetical protein